MYEDIVVLGREHPSLLADTERLADEEIASLRAEHPTLPVDYLGYLGEIGWGSLAGGRFMIYGGPIEPAEILGLTPAGLEGALLLGDDFAGYCVGLHPNETGVIEIGFGAIEYRVIAASFDAFIHEKIAELIECLDD